MPSKPRARWAPPSSPTLSSPPSMRVRASCLAPRAHGVLSPIQQAEREEAIADWLDDHGVDSDGCRTARRNRGDDRRARPGRGGGHRARARRRSALGGGRMLGSRARLGDSGSGDAHLRPGHGHQGIHAHGSGDGGRARGPDVEPRQHGRRAQVEGAGEVGRRDRRRRARPPAGSRLRRRAQPDLGEPDRQRARRRRRRPAAST